MHFPSHVNKIASLVGALFLTSPKVPKRCIS